MLGDQHEMIVHEHKGSELEIFVEDGCIKQAYSISLYVCKKR